MLYICMVLAFSLCFLLSFIYLWRRDKLFSVYYLCLFIYTIFTQVGFVIVPEVAKDKQVYFFRDLFTEYWLFISLSFACIFLLFVLTRIRKSRSFAFSMTKMIFPLRSFLLYGGTTVFLIALLNYTRTHITDINYIAQVSTEGGQGYAYAFGILNLLLLALYVKYRNYSHNSGARILAGSVLLIGLGVFIYVALVGGGRSKLISLIMGVGAYELIPFGSGMKVSLRKIFTLVALSVLAILFVQRIAATRGYGDASVSYFMDKTIARDDFIGNIENVVGQDYFYPSSLLFASMRYSFIRPGEVVRSNLNNILLFRNYPTLSESVGSLIIQTSRKQGGAYYVLVEGYNMLGWGGIIYNALIVVGGLAVWKWFASSNNDGYNRFMASVMISLMVAMVRSQSSYFIKNIYVMILPSILLFFLISGLRPRFLSLKCYGIKNGWRVHSNDHQCGRAKLHQ